MTEWKPIDSAPQTGEYVLVTDGSAVHQASWRKQTAREDGPARWRPYCSGIDDREYLVPRYWMPMPAPPQS